jgi:hypothetical protein
MPRGDPVGAGIDTVQASATYSLRPEVENMVLIGTAAIRPGRAIRR